MNKGLCVFLTLAVLIISHTALCQNSTNTTATPTTTTCGSSQYLSLDTNKCLDTCDWPNNQGNQNNVLTCSKPCKTGQYYNTNLGICVSFCKSPQTQDTYGGVASCTCPPKYQYTASTNACVKITCTAPLVPNNEPTSDTPCVSPCDDSDYFYVTEMKACASICHYPRKTAVKNGLKYCNQPCKSGQWWSYSQKKCVTSCSTSQRAVDFGMPVCGMKCQSDQYWIAKASRCVSYCDPDMGTTGKLSDGTKTCTSKCPGGYLYPDGHCAKTCKNDATQGSSSQDADGTELLSVNLCG